MSDDWLSLWEWNLYGIPIDRGDGEPIIDARVSIDRRGEWELVGVLNLRREEFELLKRVFLAHEGQYGKVS